MAGDDPHIPRGDLDARLAQVTSEFETRGAEQAAAAARASVVRRAWAPAHSALAQFEPLWHERHGGPRPRLRRGEPSALADVERYGLDEAGRIIECQSYGARGRTSLEVVEFTAEEVRAATWTWQLDSMSVPYGPPELFVVRVLVCGAGRPHSFVARWSQGTTAHEAYRCEGDRVVEIRECHVQPGKSERTRLLRVAYDSRGRVESIVDEPSGEFAFRRRGPDTGALEDVVVRRLVALAPGWVAAHADESQCALVLGFGVAEDPLPPSLSLVTVASRAAALREDDEDERRHMLWAPAELPVFDPVPAALADDEELAAAANALNAQWGTALDERSPRRVVTRAARDLNELDWPETADDFVVVAAEFELDGFERDAQASLGRARFRNLRKAGLV